MSAKRCLKCGHVTSPGEAPEACPQCGAIYSKVEEALRRGAAVRPNSAPPSAPAPRAVQDPVQARARNGVDVHAFAQRMRDESLYPAWRKIVGFFAIIGYVLAGVVLVLSCIAGLRGAFGSGSFSAFPITGVVVAALIALATKVSKELSLMLADLSDAAVRLAARDELGGR